MSKKILLIGGAGFLGSALQRAISADPSFDVSITSTKGDPSDPRHLTLDLLKRSDLDQINSFDIIVNLTGQSTNPPTLCEELNTTGIRNLIDAVKDGHQTVVQISTTLVYGTTKEATENSPVNPDIPYAKCKAEAESLLRQSLPHDRLLIPRLCNLYGPGQNKGLLWFLIDHVKKDKPLSILDNNGELRRFFLHVDDAARIVSGLLSRDVRGIVNVAGPEQYSIKELIALCERIVGRALPVTYANANPTGNIDVIQTDTLAKILPVNYQYTVEQYLRGELS